MWNYSTELYHHGILGQKWGVRRFQYKDGSLTPEGKKKYRTNSMGGNVVRAVTNTSLGQRLIGVGLNKGYRSDRKEIKDAYKKEKENIKNKNLSTADEKEKLKSLKKDYKITKGEARTSAANALYPWQTTDQNKKIQTQNLGKQFVKGYLLGGYGSLNYDRLVSTGRNRGAAAAAAYVTGMSQIALSALTPAAGGTVPIGDYAYGAYKVNKKK